MRRLALWMAIGLLAGCSLVFDPGVHTRGDVDAGLPDTGPPVSCTGPCGVADPMSCGSGTTCVLFGSAVTGWMGACRMAGVGGQGSPCTGTMNGECQEGFQCRINECQRICADSTDCSVDGPGNFCVPLGGADAGFCHAPVACDLVDQTGCESQPETACFASEGGLICVIPGMTVDGAECAFLNACMAGSGCFGSGGGFFCRRFCDLTAPVCEEGTACIRIEGLPVADLLFGACIPLPP